MKQYDSYSNEELIETIKGSKPASDIAFKVIYDRYSVKLFSFCKYRTDDLRSAEEVFQDAWMKFYNAVRSNYPVHTPAAFLYSSARNLIIDKYRSNSSRVSIDENFDMESLIEPLNLDLKIERDDLIRTINLALLQLDDFKREAFVLRWSSELSYQEIAEITGDSEAAVKMRCRRAMDELIKILKPFFIELTQ